jgi:hypothetical protein
MRPPTSRPRYKLLGVLDSVPDDELRGISRGWNRLCLAIIVLGLAAALILLTR